MSSTEDVLAGGLDAPGGVPLGQAAVAVVMCSSHRQDPRGVVGSATEATSYHSTSRNGFCHHGPAMHQGLTEELLMENFSRAYVRAIASAAGFSVEDADDDYDSVDCCIIAKGFIEHGGLRSKKRSPRVEVQLKCTYAHQPKGDELSYPLRIKNYDELRDLRNSIPRILVVVCVPMERKERLIWSPEELKLLRCAFWRSLRGEPEVTNTETITVTLNQRLSPDELHRLMYSVAEETLL